MNSGIKIVIYLILLVFLSLACTLPILDTIQNNSLEPQGGTVTVTDTHPTVEESDAVPSTPTLQSAPPSSESFITGSVTYDVEQTIKLMNDGPGEASRVVLWVALIQSIEPYQIVDVFTSDPSEYNELDDKDDNLYAQYEFLEVTAGETRTITLTYQVTVNAIKVEIDQCSGEMIEGETSAEKFIESDSPQILSVVDTLMVENPDTCSLARSIYDYVGDELTYSQYTPQDLGALAALNQLEGDCTEYSDLYIALNRAAEIPARFVEGVTCCTNSGYVAGENKHDWAEVYLPGYGWLPADPTWGRYPNQRDRYFASITPDHIIVTRGRYLVRLNGYHYYAYNYWWDNDSTNISSSENWSILRIQN